MMDAQLLDHMIDAEQEMKKDAMLAVLRTQVEGLSKRVINIEAQHKRKDKCTSLSERKIHRDTNLKRIDEILLSHSYQVE